MPAFRDDFDGDALDPEVWDPHYLPAWSSRAESAARHRVADSRLRLWIPPGQQLWCPEDHPTPLRGSGIAAGGHSGPVGSPVAGQHFRSGQVVREEQPRLAGWLPQGGSLAVVCRMELSERSMAAVWLSGFEESPEDSGELCLVEVFGKDRVPRRSAEVGMGIKKLNDPRLEQDFEAPRLEIDVGQWHEYAVRWDEQVAEFSVDGEHVRTCARPPLYPLQVMIAVFDFPDWLGDASVPALEVEWIGGESA